MNDQELEQMRRALAAKRDKIAGMNPFTAGNEIKASAMLAADITVELARRELARSADHA